MERIREIETGRPPVRVTHIAAAAEKFLEQCKKLRESTQHKYRDVLRHLLAHCVARGINLLSGVSVEALDQYRAERQIKRITAAKELELMRQFFRFCIKRKWMIENPALDIDQEKGICGEEVIPYTEAEWHRIAAAAASVGRSLYEPKRATALVLLLRHTGLRVSDAATLTKDRIRGDKLLLRARKNGQTVYLPLPGELLVALANVPQPRNGAYGSLGYFWNGITSQRAVVGIAVRTLAAVFKKAQINSHLKAHRFRHTLATEILASGGTLRDVADILGISERVAEKHYAKWNPKRQERLIEIMGRVLDGATYGQKSN